MTAGDWPPQRRGELDYILRESEKQVIVRRIDIVSGAAYRAGFLLLMRRHDKPS